MSRVLRRAVLSLILTFFAALVLLPLVAALSVDTLVVSPSSPVTTSILACTVQATGTGTLQANISWYRNGAAWPGDTETLALTTGVNATTSAVGSIEQENTTKGQTWRCQAVVGNGTDSTAQNSSLITILNSPPVITFPVGPISVTEDTPYTTTATATDVDGDSILSYISSDLNASLYGGVSLFTINSGTGGISFTPLNAANGNHTMAILAYDGESWGGSNIVYTIVPFDDPPVINNPGPQTATVGAAYSLTIVATDEESDPLNFTLATDSPGLTLTQLTPFTARLTFAGAAPVIGDVGVWAANITAYENTSHTKNMTLSFTVTVTDHNFPPAFTSAPNASATQGQFFSYNITANDSNPTDQLLFSIATPTCIIANPWTINTTSNLSTNATGVINVTLTNDYVACRDITLSVSDYTLNGVWRSTVNTTLTLNLTNTNDAPVVNELSSYPGYLSQHNASNLSAAVGQLFTYRVNASDPDQLTYAGDILSYSTNTSLFTINNATGAISFTPTALDVGTYNINVSIADSAGVQANRTMVLTIIADTPPSMVALGPFVCQEDTACTLNLTASDNDANENLTFTVNDSIVSSITKATYNVSQVTRTYTNDEVANYSVFLTATDRWGATNTTTFTLVVNNTNDAPIFDSNQDNVSNSLTLPGPVVAGITKVWDIVMTDVDFRNVAENLVFVSNITGQNASLFTITKTQYNKGVITFTPAFDDIGNYNVTINVTDAAGASVATTLPFTVVNAGLPPTIDAAQPYFTGVTQVNNTLTATLGANTTAVAFAENQTINFNLSVSDPDTALVNLTVSYYWDNALVATADGTNPYYARPLDFFSSGNHTMLAVVEDDRLANITFQWNVSITNVKRRPIVTGVMQNRTVNSTTTFVNELKFLDPDDDLNSNGVIDGNETSTLTFTPAANADLTFTYLHTDITATPLQSGFITFAYTATTADGLYSVDGNNVTYTVFFNQIQQQQQSSSSGGSSGGSGGGGGGGGGSFTPVPRFVPEPYSIDILTPKPLTVYENGTVIAPIAIHNPSNTTLKDITLSAVTEANVSMQFLDDKVAQLDPGKTFNTSLAIKGYRFAGTFEVVVTANVKEPRFNDSAIFFLNSLEKGSAGDAINTKITSARDLLTENPVCGELTQLVDQAKAAYANGDTAHANELLVAVSSGCAYLKAQQARELEQPSIITGWLGKGSTNIILGGALLALLIVGAMLVAHYARQE